MTKKETVATESNKAKLVSELINNPKTQFTSEDETWLNEQSEAILEKLIPVNRPQSKQYTRIDSVCDAVKNEPATVKEWSEKADAMYVEKGGKSKLTTSVETVKWIAKVLRQFPIKYEIPKK
jgi:4-hydroxy-3-methylbut-2-enyl diphosphate reductase IspH